jgi:hypothetical protein
MAILPQIVAEAGAAIGFAAAAVVFGIAGGIVAICDYLENRRALRDAGAIR